MKYPYLLELPEYFYGSPVYWQNFIDSIDRPDNWNEVSTQMINEKLEQFSAECIDHWDDPDCCDLLFKTEHGHMLFVLKYS